MIYWHIQMHLPAGRQSDLKIDPRKMLQLERPVIGSAIWDDAQSKQFQGENNGLKVNDVILVREGQRPIALCKVESDVFPDDNLSTLFHHNVFRYVSILQWVDSEEPFPQPQGTLERLINSSTASWKYINTLYTKILSQLELSEILGILKVKPQIILQGPPGTGKTYQAKKIAEALTANGGTIKLIQFHPAYSYEDFVRGIIAKPNEGQIEYIVENRVLADFASKAHKNYLDSQKDAEEISREVWVRKIFEDFKDDLITKIEAQNGIELTSAVSITSVEDDAFRYTGQWKSSQRMKYDDIIELYLNHIIERQNIVKYEKISALAKTHATYFKHVLDKFRAFASKYTFPQNEVVREPLRNYVLIIDEINRANLPAVLGELIYALEYRGETVDSMYKLEGDNRLVLPPNLFIIGTMNTADRSVGDIDYAIRRGFAFVDVFPSVVVLDEVIKHDVLKSKAKMLFEAVGALFTEFLATDFDSKDVRLGHSFFLADSEESLRLKLSYEIKPILREYVKDGILQGDTVKNRIESLHV